MTQKRTPFYLLAIALILHIVAMDAIAVQPASTQNAGEPDLFDPTQGYVIGHTNTAVVWTREILHPETRFHEAQIFSVHYFVQELGGNATAREAGRMDHGPVPESATVLPDGTMLLYVLDRFYWAAPGQPMRLNNQDLHLSPFDHFTLYSDGIIWEKDLRAAMTVPGFHELSATWWVPIRDGRFDVAAKIQLEELGEPRKQFVRRGSQIAWLDMTRDAKWFPEKFRQPPAVYVFDVSRKAVQSTSPPVEFAPSSRLMGIDGNVAFDGVHLINVATGEIKTIPFVNADLGLLNGMGYVPMLTPDGLHEEVIQTPLEDPTKARSVVQRSQTGYPTGNLFFLTDQSLRAWNGRTWESIAPLK
jgi:hypothetical protein